MVAPPFVVLDTNVVLDWLIYQDTRIAPLIDALGAGRMRLASDDACLSELTEVLAREEIRATQEQRRTALQTYCSTAHMVAAAVAQLPQQASALPALPIPLADLPQCRDPDDQIFIELAVRCRARALVSRDKALLRMHHRMLLIANLAVVEPAAALDCF